MEAPKSPDVLELRSKPNVGPRVGRRIMLIAGVSVCLVMAVIIFNTEKRRQATVDAPKKDAVEAAERLRPASAAATAMNGAVTDEVKAVTQAEVQAPPPPAQLEVPVAAAPPGYEVVPPIDGAPTQDASAAHALEQQRANDLATAMNASTAAGNWTSGADATPSSAPPAADSMMDQMFAEMRKNNAANQAAANAAGIAAQGGQPTDPNMQDQKRAFLGDQQAEKQLATPILPANRKAAPTPYVLNTGTVIPGVMLQGLNSDLPGELVGMVTSTVYDSTSGSLTLIPQGTKLFGVYDSGVAFGQNRALVVWKRLVFPDGSTLELGGMQGNSMNGYAGFEDQVNNHYGRILGFGVLTSLFSAGFQLSQPQQNSATGQLTNQQTVASAVGQQITSLGTEVTRKNLNIQPTIEIRPGYRFNVMVNRDIVFQAPYIP